MKKLLYISALISVALACGAMPALPNTVFPSLSAAPVPSREIITVEMVVIADEGLNIRADHSELSADIGDLFPGDVVHCETPFFVKGDSIWCKHEYGWSNARWLMVESKEHKKE